MSTIKPIHQHDCDCCEFHGQVVSSDTIFDVYFCPRCDDGTVIARFGDLGDYSSFPVDVLKSMQKTDSAIFKAYELVKARKEYAKTHSLSTGLKLGPLASLL